MGGSVCCGNALKGESEFSVYYNCVTITVCNQCVLLLCIGVTAQRAEMLGAGPCDCL